MSNVDTLDVPSTSDLDGLAIDVAEERTAHGQNRARSLSRGSWATKGNVFVRLDVDTLSVCDLCSRNTKGNPLSISRGNEGSRLLRLR